MKITFDIYILGSNLIQNNHLIELLNKNFNVKIINDLKSDLPLIKQSILLIFDHRLSEKVITLKNKYIKKQIPLIAYIDSTAETEATKIALLEEGIDDILFLDMNIQEQIARINKIIQIYLQTAKRIIKVSDIFLDKTVQVGTYRNDNLNLSKIEFEILYTLFKNYKVEITRDKLSSTIWKEQSPNNLNKHLSNIKKKVEHTPIEIVSRRGKGITVQLKSEI